MFMVKWFYRLFMAIPSMFYRFSDQKLMLHAFCMAYILEVKLKLSKNIASNVKRN